MARTGRITSCTTPPGRKYRPARPAERSRRAYEESVHVLIRPAGSAYVRTIAHGTRAVGVQAYHDGVAGYVVRHDSAIALVGIDSGPHRWRRRLELLVQRMFVLQAAHQSPTRPGDAHRVERQILVFGHS